MIPRFQWLLEKLEPLLSQTWTRKMAKASQIRSLVSSY